MTILTGEALRNHVGLNGRTIVTPWLPRTKHWITGTTYGESYCGYDIRLDEEVHLEPGGFKLASTLELFDMPVSLVGIVHDKSTLARMGVTVQNTVIEPGWAGYLTLELTNHGADKVFLPTGAPIAQVLFHMISGLTTGYDGKYQDQERGPQGPR
jgi:dCTP deaminase